ncbi:xanthine dehydrogenase small subunit [Aquipuribacter sp. MA13-6]|uniref:xanthine dehydrogenase small subunit n=1 Tax=unclassified Aquipuribacter TaxID=2635084 RepID=UPI003EEAFE66
MVDVEPLVLRLNGRDVALGGLPPTATLLRAVRAQGLVGTKEGCGDGDCGACTVVLTSSGPDGTPTHRAVNSCLVPVGSVVGLDVVTVEGVAAPDGGLHPVQQAVVDCAGSQCGYCTPGVVMSMFAGYHDPVERGPDGVDPAVVEGNLCRCTGYTSIRRACRRLGAPEGTGADAPAPRASTAHVAAVTSAGRTFLRPTALADALALLAGHPDATLVAGGTDLGLELSHRTLDPAVVVSLEHVVELQRLRRTATHLQVGAGVTLTRLEREAAGLLPALEEMLHWFAARQVRNRATLGGNLGTASPIGDLPPVLLALDADVHLDGPDGPRTVAVADFFTGYRETRRRPGEVVTRVDLPLGPGAGATTRLSGSYKVGKRGTDDISVVAAAFTVDLDAEGTVVHARLAYGGVAATPVRAHEVESTLLGTRLDRGTVARAAGLLRDTFTPLDDLRASADYRRRLVGSLFEKFCAEHAPPVGDDRHPEAVA